MKREKQIYGLCKLHDFLADFLKKDPENYNETERDLQNVLKKSEIENPWFSLENQKYALAQWVELLTLEKLHAWVDQYPSSKTPKRLGLILAGNIPMVGFHDVLCVILSGHFAVIKLSSKDRLLSPFLLKLWNNEAEGLPYELVDKLENYDAVIATGSNNTAKYFEYYFKDFPHIIRKNRTSVAVLTGEESSDDLQKLAEDIFRYFGLGCRNVTHLLLPQEFLLDHLFESFSSFKDVINHHKYANNYDYNRAVYLLNQERFWDNNFVMLKESDALFSPLSVVHFKRYQTLTEVEDFLIKNQQEIQCVVGNTVLKNKTLIPFGTSQSPDLTTYADDVNTMAFLQTL